MYYTIILRDAQAVFAYQTKTAAIQKFHEEIAYGMSLKIATTALVIDQSGYYAKSPEVYDPAEEV